MPQTHTFINRYVMGLTILSGMFFALMLGFFFSQLGTASSDYSAGGVSATVQFFYNFLNDRPFQTTLYAIDESIGFKNPYAYLNTYAIHVNLTPFLFAPIWNLWPNITWLYGLVFLVNYASMAIFAWKTLKHLSPHSYKIKAFMAIGLVLSSGFLFTFQQNAQFLLLSGPFILGAYYFLQTRQKAMFVICMMLLCLISEDAAMVAVMFSLYVYLFERDARSFAYWAGTLSFVYLAAVLFVIQPIARAELNSTSSTTALVVIKQIADFNFDLGTLLVGFAPVLFFAPAFVIAGLLFGKPGVSWAKIAGLVFIAPFPHWGQSAVVGATHHLLPVVVFVFAAFVTVLGRTPDIQPSARSFPKQSAILILGLTAIFWAASMRTLVSNLPEQILLPLYKLAGKNEKVKKLEQSIAERQGNQHVLEVVRRIPKENSLVFWTNGAIGGSIADRSDIWPFPHYYAAADYLVLQPGAGQAAFSFPTMGNLTFKESLAKGKALIAYEAMISEDSVDSIVRDLVAEKKSHRLVLREPGVVLLERVEKQALYIPSSTVGFGWIQNIGLWSNRKADKSKEFQR